VRAGIAQARIRVETRGERELLVPTADGVAEAKNRRVEITVR
jgi:outer membrane protein OmpA-like peptidoglycan-associated protein